MRRIQLYTFFCVTLLLQPCVQAGMTPGSKDLGAIWFIGDSITQSNADLDTSGSPRKSLYDLLVPDGYTFTYTGHRNENVDGLPVTGGTVSNNLYHYHSGKSGIRIGEAGGAVGFATDLTSTWVSNRLAVVKPNVILIMLGTNDVVTPDGAIDRLRKLIQDIFALPGVGDPTIFLATIPPNRRNAGDIAFVASFNAGVPGIVNEYQGLGKDVRYVDQFTPLDNVYASCMNADDIHPNGTGNDIMAQTWFDAISSPVASFIAIPSSGAPPLDVTFDASSSTGVSAIVSYSWDFGDGTTGSGVSPSHTYTELGKYEAFLVVTSATALTGATSADVRVMEWPGSLSDFHGFDLYTFTTNGLDCKVAVPDVIAEGKPWIWRARFWDHESDPDVALLSNGYHVVYVDVADLYGSPTAVTRFDGFYDFLTGEHSFDQRMVLEGMSRGGLIIFNWAAQNPEKVHCVYADAPVCDFKSWPYETGAPADWTNCLTAYGMTEGQALVYGGNPVDNMQGLADAGIPLLHVVGDADITVPVSNNTEIVEDRYNTFGGWIKVIHKPGVAHVHGLDDPTPIIEFILDSMNDIHNLPATSVDEGSATLNGLLSLTGTNYNIQTHWGTTDGGTNAAAWDQSVAIGSWTTGDSNLVSLSVFSLVTDTNYYYSFSATNSSEHVWDDSASFVYRTKGVLNLNAGESTTGQESMNGETWNNLNGRGAVITNLYYADGSVANGIAVSQTAGGEYTPNASGYITGLDSMATNALWQSSGDDTSYLTIAGLATGSVWNVDIYCAIRYDARTSILSANGVVSADTNTYGGRFDLHAPVIISNIVADASGTIAIASAGYNPLNIPAQNGVLNGVTIVPSSILPGGNVPPVAHALAETVDEGGSVALTLTGSDGNDDSLTFTVATSPTNGTLSGTAPDLTYEPNTNFYGSDSFTFMVNDGTVDSAAATVSLTITQVSVPPVSAGGAMTLNINAGESTTGQETINSETWNNLSGRGTAIGSLQYANGSAATDITVMQTAQGENASDGGGVDYIAPGSEWDTMSTAILWCNAGSGGSHLTISNLTAGSLWNVDVYAGLKNRYTVPNHETTISVNGASGGDITLGDLWDTHAPMTFNDIAADSNGKIIISADKGGIGVLSGATLRKHPPKATVISIQ